MDISEIFHNWNPVNIEKMEQDLALQNTAEGIVNVFQKNIDDYTSFLIKDDPEATQSIIEETRKLTTEILYCSVADLIDSSIADENLAKEAKGLWQEMETKLQQTNKE